MLDDRNIKDRSPFDVTTIDDREAATIEEQISSLIPRRDREPSAATVRRAFEQGNRQSDGTPSKDRPTVAAKAGQADAGEARHALLEERQSTHGSFADNARVSQSIKRILRAEPGWELLTDVEREAMDMIALKFSRILSGKSLELQHWEDVVGYGKLAEEQCKGVE